MNNEPANEKIETFRRQYREALLAHMRKSSHQLVSKAARSLGKQALAQEIQVLEIIRLHMANHRQLAVGSTEPEKKEHAFMDRSSSFLMEALTVMESSKQKKTDALSCENERLRDQLKERSAQCEQLTGSLKALEKQSRFRSRLFIVSQEEERKQISRDLHDQIAQTLAGINVRLATIKRISAQDTATLKKNIFQTQRLVERSVKIVHSFARKLRPGMLDDLGLIPSIRAMFKDLPNLRQLEIRFSAQPEVEQLSSQYRTVIYRVVQEALTNVVRHARAKSVEITISRDSEAVHLEVQDDGRAFKVDRVLSSGRGKHLGLLGMRERIEMVGGQFLVSSLQGKGTTIQADIPLTAASISP